MRTALLTLLYVGLAALGSYLTFRPTFDSGFESIQTERGDGALNHYILENSWLALADPGYRGSLLTPPFYHPAKWTVYYSENLFGVAPLYWLLRLFAPYDLAYAWWQIILNVLNFVAFALVARWWRWPHLVTLGGAFMWAFAMVHADQIKHQQLICRFWMPFAVYYAIALVAEPSAKALNRLCGCVFLQCLACIYTGWFLVAGLGVFVPALVLMLRGAAGGLRRFARENRGAVFRVLALWGVAMLALFGPYMLVNWGIGRKYEDTHFLMPTPSAWFTGSPGSKWDETTAPYRTLVSLECWLFSGFTFYLLLLAAAVWLPFSRGASAPVGDRPGPAWSPALERAVIAAAVAAVALWVVVTLTPENKGESLWRWVRYLPGGMAIRCVSRVYLIVYLFGTIAGLAWLNRVTRGIRRDWLRLAVQALVVGAMIFEQTEYQQPSFERRNFYPLVDEAAEKLKGAEVGWVVPRYKDHDGDVSTGPYGEVFGMWVGLRANVPVLNGYSGRAPKGFPPMGALSDEQIRDWLRGKFRGTVRIVDTEAPPDYMREVVVE